MKEMDQPIPDTQLEYPEQELQKPLDTERALDAIFRDLDKTTIPAIIIGVILLTIFYILKWKHVLNEIGVLIFASITGLILVFGTSELIILGVKGIADKLNWSPYFGGILSSIGAALSELVLVIILLLKGNKLLKSSDPAEIATGNELILTAIVLILTTVLINMLFLGIAMIFTTRKSSFKLPLELTLMETNLVIGMVAFSFMLMLYGIIEKILELDGVILGATFNRTFESITGVALLIIYCLFVLFMLRQMSKRTATYQPHITEFLLGSEEGKEADEFEEEKKEKKNKGNEEHAFISFRRFPWIIIIILFAIGLAGVILGGNVLAEGIETGAEKFEDIPVLVYSVIVGFVSSSPELIVTFRGLMSHNKEVREIGLINQVSAINQTFFILFGVPFIISGLVGIGIPTAIEITVIFGGIFILAECIHIMILDDKAFDLLEGALVTILSLVCLALLVFVE